MDTAGIRPGLVPALDHLYGGFHDGTSPHWPRCSTTGRLRFGPALGAGGVTVLPSGDRGMRRLLHALLLATPVLLTVGFLTDMLWLLGIGAWTLIAALLIEVIYRP